MDSLSGIREPLPDVGAADRESDVRRQIKRRSKGTARRGAKEDRQGQITASDQQSHSRTEDDGDSMPQRDRGEEEATGQDLPADCYGADKTIAAIPPSKGRLIDIAI